MKKYSGSIFMIHPTQCSVGFAEVAIKMDELSKLYKANELDKYLKEKIIPCVLGPNNIIYITDHHHMGLALTLLSSEWKQNNPSKDQKLNPYINCTFDILHDFSKTNLLKKDFFNILESLNFLHAFDENGKKCNYNLIPKRLVDLKNDSYRSLAGFVRKSGGFKKINQPYLEFLWADFFRNYIDINELDLNMKDSVAKSVGLALSDKAKNLPGWVGLDILKPLKPNWLEKINSGRKKALNFDIQDSVEIAKTKLKSKPIRIKKN